MQPIPLESRALRMILADWFAHLARAAGSPLISYGSRNEEPLLGESSPRREAFTFESANSYNVRADFTPDYPYLHFSCSDPEYQNIIDEIAARAIERVSLGDFGGIVWHTATCVALDYQRPDIFSMGSLLERLGGQTRILGWRRLGANILLNFQEEKPQGWGEKPEILAPKTIIHIHIGVPAPCHGHFSSATAEKALEVASAISTFALGRAVSLPPVIPPTEAENLAEISRLQYDPAVGTLARKYIPLDIFSQASIQGGLDHYSRLRSAFLTFDAGIRQEHDSISCILYVVASECLTAPETEWRSSALTKRFIKFLDELMPSELDKIVAHSNFEQVFGIRRGKRNNSSLRRELLEKIYDFRSGHLHSGLRPRYHGMGSVFESFDEIRRPLFAEFAEGAILRYLSSPRSSLIGHPNFNQLRAKEISFKEFTWAYIPSIPPHRIK